MRRVVCRLLGTHIGGLRDIGERLGLVFWIMREEGREVGKMNGEDYSNGLDEVEKVGRMMSWMMMVMMERGPAKVRGLC